MQDFKAFIKRDAGKINMAVLGLVLFISFQIMKRIDPGVDYTVPLLWIALPPTWALTAWAYWFPDSARSGA